jgi:hypothetical protein
VEVNTGLFEYYSFWLCPECSKKESDTCHTHAIDEENNHSAADDRKD